MITSFRASTERNNSYRIAIFTSSQLHSLIIFFLVIPIESNFGYIYITDG